MIHRDKRTSAEKIYCIGDSHVSFFSGTNWIQPLWPKEGKDIIPIFKTFRLGAVLAYNLCEYGTSLKGRELLSVILDRQVPTANRAVPPESKVLFCFGEIDCRAHLLKQQQTQNKPISAIVEECIARYFSVIKETKNLGYQMIVWNAVASTRHDTIANKEFPTFGSCVERNRVTRLFNNCLQQKCEAEGIVFLNIFDRLLDPDGLTNMSYYLDPIHLAQKAMPLVLEEMRIKLGDRVIYPGLINEVNRVQKRINFQENILKFGRKR